MISRVPSARGFQPRVGLSAHRLTVLPWDFPSLSLCPCPAYARALSLSLSLSLKIKREREKTLFKLWWNCLCLLNGKVGVTTCKQDWIGLGNLTYLPAPPYIAFPELVLWHRAGQAVS